MGGSDVTRHKPAPEPYLLAASRLGVERALVLEDSAAGIASGRAAGFEVLTVRHPSEVAGLLRADWPDCLPERTGSFLSPGRASVVQVSVYSVGKA